MLLTQPYSGPKVKTRFGVLMTTGAPTGITVPHSADYDLSDTDFTLPATVRLPDYTPAAEQWIYYKYQDANNYWGLRIAIGGYLNFIAVVASSTILDITSTATISATDATSAHLSFSCTREASGVDGSGLFSVNGATLGTAVAITAATPASISNTGILYILGTSAAGTYSISVDCKTYAIALSAAQVLTLYSTGVIAGATLQLESSGIAEGSGLTWLDSSGNGNNASLPITGATKIQSTGRSLFSPAVFFLSGANGLWLDNDPSTWFEDSAMTIPATFGNPIGAWKDKSGNAIDALQTTAGARPTYGRMPYGGVRNQLLNTAVMSTQSRTVSAVEKTLSFTGTGTVTLSGASTAGPLVGTGVSDRVSLTFTPSDGTLTMTVSGSVTLAQLENAATPSNYQQVVLRWDVTESGVASVPCPWFDGVDDFLDFTSTGGAGLARNVGQLILVGAVYFTAALSAARPVFHISTATAAEDARAFLGGFAKNTLQGRGRRLDADAVGLASTSQSTFTNTVATTDYQYTQSDIYLRKNGALAASNTSFQTAGNTSDTNSLACYLGAAGALRLGGFLPSVFAIADTALSDAQLLQLETYMAQQIGVTGL